MLKWCVISVLFCRHLFDIWLHNNWKFFTFLHLLFFSARLWAQMSCLVPAAIISVWLNHGGGMVFALWHAEMLWRETRLPPLSVFIASAELCCRGWINGSIQQDRDEWKIFTASIDQLCSTVTAAVLAPGMPGFVFMYLFYLGLRQERQRGRRKEG